jgi:hypothetical protein
LYISFNKFLQKRTSENVNFDKFTAEFGININL